MSRKKNIKSPWAIIDKPVYMEIRELLQKENRPMTTKEIQSRLFPKRSPQNVNKYLNYLTEQSLVHKDRGNKVTGKRTTYRYQEFGNEQALARMRLIDYFVKGRKNHVWVGQSIEEMIKGLRRMKKDYPNISIERTLEGWGTGDNSESTAVHLFDDITIDARKKVDNIFKKCSISDKYELIFEARRDGELFYKKVF